MPTYGRDVRALVFGSLRAYRRTWLSGDVVEPVGHPSGVMRHHPSST
jgi:hypothetical protein